MLVERARPDEAHAQALGGFSTFDVEVIKHFHVIANKTDRCNDDFGYTFVCQFPNDFAEIGF